MTRKKVKLAYITNDSARKATYKKRKKGLMKKVSELSTLCDIQACAIIYSPYDSQPETWPPNPAGVHQVLSRFKKVPQMEQCKKMVNQEKFLTERIKKAAEQLRKQERDNREKEVNQAVYHCLTGRIALHNLTIPDLDVIAMSIEQQIKDVERRVTEVTRRGGGGSGGRVDNLEAAASSSSSQAAVEAAASSEVVVGPKEEYHVESMESLQRQQWFVELMNNPVPAADQHQHQHQMGTSFMGDNHEMMTMNMNMNMNMMMMMPSSGESSSSYVGINHGSTTTNPFCWSSTTSTSSNNPFFS